MTELSFDQCQQVSGGSGYIIGGNRSDTTTASSGFLSGGSRSDDVSTTDTGQSGSGGRTGVILAGGE